MDLKPLITKYGKPGPRYTSYPTAPQWTEKIGVQDFRSALARVPEDHPLALYVHIPFCEQLCYYCGCNIKISNDRGVSSPYIDRLIGEIKALRKCFGSRRPLLQISLGGGTPTYSTPADLTRLYQSIDEHFVIEKDAEVSIEIDPRVTSEEQLSTLRTLGFNRVSLGVQDFNEDVQEVVNRRQSYEETSRMLKFCRKLGYRGINFDLIYGLPLQTLETFKTTVDRVIHLRPDRIALYNYAHLPSLRPHQKILEQHRMPPAEERTAIFEYALSQLSQAGYLTIGMDHFAVKDDELALALENGSLYRNFMGYTVKKGTDLLGVGASAISEVGGGFFQNLREVGPYQEAIDKEGAAAFRGLLLSDDDRERKWIIQHLMCGMGFQYSEYSSAFGANFTKKYSDEVEKLKELEGDGLIEVDENRISVTDLGRLFVRNASMEFDAYLARPQNATYSRTL